MGWHGKQRRCFKATTNSNQAWPVAANLWEQTFTAPRPEQVGVTVIIYLPTAEGWLYLAGVKDLYTCAIVGYALGERLTQGLVGQALFRAVQAKRPPVGRIHHSDRGSQYWAHEYRERLAQFGMQASMSRRGNGSDKAPMESFWGSLKSELVHPRRYGPRTEAKASIRGYIEIFYNRQRRHSRLGYMAPAVFAQHFSKQQASA